MPSSPCWALASQPWDQTNLSFFLLQGIDYSAVKPHDPTTNFLYRTQVKELKWTSRYSIRKVEVASTCSPCLCDQRNHTCIRESLELNWVTRPSNPSMDFTCLSGNEPQRSHTWRQQFCWWAACLIHAPAAALAQPALSEGPATSLCLDVISSSVSSSLSSRECQTPSTRPQGEAGNTGGRAPGWLGGGSFWYRGTGGDGEILGCSQGTVKMGSVGVGWGTKSRWRTLVTLAKTCPASCSIWGHTVTLYLFSRELSHLFPPSRSVWTLHLPSSWTPIIFLITATPVGVQWFSHYSFDLQFSHDKCCWHLFSCNRPILSLLEKCLLKYSVRF